MGKEDGSSSGLGLLCLVRASINPIRRLRGLLMARIKNKYNAVRCRAMRDVEAQAAKSGKRN